MKLNHIVLDWVNCSPTKIYFNFLLYSWVLHYKAFSTPIVNISLSKNKFFGLFIKYFVITLNALSKSRNQDSNTVDAFNYSRVYFLKSDVLIKNLLNLCVPIYSLSNKHIISRKLLLFNQFIQ